MKKVIAMPERITITIKKELLGRIDKSIDKNNVRNRSHAIERLIVKALGKTGIETALLLAGGDGARLRPITYEMPKALIPVAGRPVLEWQLELLKKYEIRKILLSTGHLADKIENHLGNGARYGVDITYIKEDSPMGSAGPLSLAKSHIRGTFLMLNVDTLLNADIAGMYEFHKNHGSIATALLATSSEPGRFGVFRVHGSRVVEFTEKPRHPKTNLINAGLCIFEPDALKYVPRKRFMIEELFTRLVKRQQLCGFLHDGYAYDVGTPEGYERAVKEMRK